MIGGRAEQDVGLTCGVASLASASRLSGRLDVLPAEGHDVFGSVQRMEYKISFNVS